MVKIKHLYKNQHYHSRKVERKHFQRQFLIPTSFVHYYYIYHGCSKDLSALISSVVKTSIVHRHNITTGSGRSNCGINVEY